MQAAVAVFHPSVVFAHEASDVFTCCHRIIAAIGEGGVAEAVEQFALGADVSHQATHIINHTTNLRHGHAGVDYGLAGFTIVARSYLAYQAANIGCLTSPCRIGDIYRGTGFTGTKGGAVNHLGSNTSDVINIVRLVGEIKRIINEHVLHFGSFGQLTEKAKLFNACEEAAVDAFDHVACAIESSSVITRIIRVININWRIWIFFGWSAIESYHRSDGYPKIPCHVQVVHQDGFGVWILLGIIFQVMVFITIFERIQSIHIRREP